MGKNLFLSLMAAVFMTTPVWAQQTWTLGGTNSDPAGMYDNSQWFAKESFGLNSDEVEISLTGTTVAVTADLSASGAAISPGRKADIEFCLDGTAQFASAAPGLSATETASGTSILSGTVKATATVNSEASTGGGRPGHRCVTYTVTTTAALNQTLTSFTLAVPKVENVSFLGNADDPGVNRTDPSDNVPPTVVMSVRVIPDDLGAPANTVGFTAFPTAEQAASKANKRTIARSLSRFEATVSPTAQDTAASRRVLIDLNDRTMFASGADITNARVETITGIGDGERKGILLSTVRVKKNSRANAADLSGLFEAVSGASGDKLDISVTGSGVSFTDADILFLSSNAAYNMNSDTRLTVSGSTASSSVELVNIATAADDAQGPEFKLYYVPAAGRTLTRDAAFTTTYQLNFAAATRKDSEQMSTGSVTLELSGLSTRGYAYAVTPDNSPAGDRGSLRIRCEDTSACVVFLECFNHAGDRVGDFVSIGDNIAPNAVAVISSDRLENLIGSWRGQGRLSCEVVSSGPVGVQMFTRSSGGVLVNNSYINRGLDSSSSD